MLFFYSFIYFFTFIFFPLYSMGTKLLLHVYIFFPHPLFCCTAMLFLKFFQQPRDGGGTLSPTSTRGLTQETGGLQGFPALHSPVPQSPCRLRVPTPGGSADTASGASQV